MRVQRQNVRVLIAEDNYLVGETIKEMLREVGYTVVGQAMDGLQAVAMTQSIQPDVILMDIEMPDMDGIEATRRIYECCPTPVVMLTAYETEELVARASEAGAGAYLVKPPQAHELKRTIMIALARFDDMVALRESNRRLEETLVELQATQEQVIKQERLAAVGQLAAGVAHQFNNIMTSIILCADMMLRTPNLAPRAREQLGTIREEGHRAADLTQQILDFSRKAMLRRQDMNLVPFLRDVRDLLQRELSKDIRIHLACDVEEAATLPPSEDRGAATLPPSEDRGAATLPSVEKRGAVEKISVNADPQRLQQAIVNLALNAQDAMPEGGSLHFMLIRLQLEPGDPPPLPDIQPGEWARLTVTDTGTGIPPDVLPHIFEPFFTTQAPLRKGLGLPQAYGIIKQHGGHMDVKTEVGAGTSLTIYLPALPASRAQDPSPGTRAMPQGSGEIILVMEGHPGTRQALAHSLEMLNYRVLAAPNGQEALALFKQHGDEIALVLSDLVMPEIGGMALCQALKKLDPSVRVVILTDYPKEGQGEDLDALGVVDWLKKPVSLDQLARAVARALEAHPLPNPSEGGRPRPLNHPSKGGRPRPLPPSSAERTSVSAQHTYTKRTSASTTSTTGSKISPLPTQTPTDGRPDSQTEVGSGRAEVVDSAERKEQPGP